MLLQDMDIDSSWRFARCAAEVHGWRSLVHVSLVAKRQESTGEGHSALPTPLSTILLCLISSLTLEWTLYHSFSGVSASQSHRSLEKRTD